MRASAFLVGIVSLGVAALFCGCASKPKVEVQNASPSVPTLKRNARFYIGYPQNIAVKGDPVIDSGRLTMEELRKAFTRQAPGVYTGRRPETLDEAKRNAATISATYLVWATVLRWEDRATEWSGRRDKVQIRLELWELPEERLLDFRVIEGTSSWMTDGGDRPQDLLKEPFEKYAEAFFAPPTYTPSQMPPLRR